MLDELVLRIEIKCVFNGIHNWLIFHSWVIDRMRSRMRYYILNKFSSIRRELAVESIIHIIPESEIMLIVKGIIVVKSVMDRKLLAIIFIFILVSHGHVMIIVTIFGGFLLCSLCSFFRFKIFFT